MCERADGGIFLVCLISFKTGEIAVCGGWWKKRQEKMGENLQRDSTVLRLCLSKA